ncbi:RagB/SusD family nutrient uptake outer membrane protein [Mucilaginibacter sp.]|uniref:RagB/SusD family nutrient uptake outer membrane protein n=1 Tax=Mucilaginibacter sp. TaxID=1882438 RepID=UPI0025DB9812|nr:RagB/SusD family nutrient uptake outer membrane protein [Mucilaginibacter sp.]
MKTKYKIILPLCFIGLIIIYGCKKSFLDKQPLGSLSSANVTSLTGVQGLLIGAYSVLDGEIGLANSTGFAYGSAGSNWVYGSVCADDSYKGSTPTDQPDLVLLQTWSVSSANTSYVQQKWQMLFDGVQRSNEVLRVLPNVKDISDADGKVIAGEARFLRAFYHFGGKIVFNNFPYVDESVSVANNNLNVPNVDKTGKFIDIWPYI